MTAYAPGEAMVATSHPLAVDAALDVLAAGGTAVDAAVAAVAVLTVVDPPNTGLGGDLFALIWEPGAPGPVGLASAGVAPAGMTVQSVRAAGHDTMPEDGPWAVTVPGAPAGWQALLDRYGTLDRERVLEAAIRHAEQGAPVPAHIAEVWPTAEAKLRRDAAATEVFLPGGRPPREGEVFANPQLAEVLRRFARDGATPFYTGDIAERIAAAVQAHGGPMLAGDLAAWGGPEWVTPVRAPFRDHEVIEMPPPGQGIVVLETLGIYGAFPQALGAADPVEADHLLIESLKLAIDDAAAYVADPAFVQVPVERMLSAEYLAAQRARIGASAAAGRDPGNASDTVYVAVVDGRGGACSLIQSLFRAFGSGISVPGLGLLLQNRGSGFVLDDRHPARPEPGKRPFHTIIPAMLARDGQFAGCLGVVGGYMQPQGHVQVLRNVLDRGMSPQEALDAPRLRIFEGRRVLFEEGYDPAVTEALAGRGHEVGVLPRTEAGGGQMILRTERGLRGGSDPRRDGYVGSRRV